MVWDIIKGILKLTWHIIVEWLHSNDQTVASHIMKLLVAMFIFIVASDVLKKLVRFVKEKLKKKGLDHIFFHFVLELIRHAILIYLIFMIIIQLDMVQATSNSAILISSIVAIVLFAQGALSKGLKHLIFKIVRIIRNDVDEISFDSTWNCIFKMIGLRSSGSLSFLLEGLFKLCGVAVMAIAIVFIYQGIFYVLGNGGEDVTSLLKSSETNIEKSLGSTFEYDDELAKQIPIYAEGNQRIKTDGDLNIIYLNGIKIGMNTTSRKYNFYGVSINQAEIITVEEISYDYENVIRPVVDMTGGSSNTYVYYNRENNDCLIVIVNNKSNRVVNMTYYEDLSKVEKNLLTVEED